MNKKIYIGNDYDNPPKIPEGYKLVADYIQEVEYNEVTEYVDGNYVVSGYERNVMRKTINNKFKGWYVLLNETN
jgi:hypothetical protein